ncbi:MAG: hypothetical protein ACXVXP_06255 [Mycobacteriaceae bacterium]
MPSWTHERAKLAAHKRHHPDSDLTEIRRDLKAAHLASYIKRVCDAAPPLTPEQRDRLALLLRGGVVDDVA